MKLGSAVHVFSAAVSYSASQTYEESTFSVNTFHETNYLDQGEVNSKTGGNFGFELYITPESLVLFELMGFTLNTQTGLYTFDQSDMTTDFYMQFTDYTVHLSNSILTRMSLSIGKGTILKANFEGMCSELKSIATENRESSSPSKYYTGDLILTKDDVLVPRAISASLDINRDISWLQDRTISNTLYTPSSHIINSIAVSGTIGLYRTGEYKMDYSLATKYKIKIGSFEVVLPVCIVTERNSMEDTIVTYADYRLQASSSATTITGT